MNTELGELIKKIRMEKSLSQRELARRIDIDNAAISRIEKGLIKKPSSEILFRIYQELGINFVTLLKLAKYSDKELWELAGIGNRVYNQLEFMDDIDEELTRKITTLRNGDVIIDVVKVLNAYKSGIIDEKQTIRLIVACNPIDVDNQIIYLSEKGDVIIDNPFSH